MEEETDKMYEESVYISAIHNIFITKIILPTIFMGILQALIWSIPCILIFIIFNFEVLNHPAFKIGFKWACIINCYIRYHSWFDKFTGLQYFYLNEFKQNTRRKYYRSIENKLPVPDMNKFCDIIDRYRSIMSILHHSDLLKLIVSSIPSIAMYIILTRLGIGV